jgi:hypothetical protein
MVSWLFLFEHCPSFSIRSIALCHRSPSSFCRPLVFATTFSSKRHVSDHARPGPRSPRTGSKIKSLRRGHCELGGAGVLALVPWSVRGLHGAPAIEHEACQSAMSGEPPCAIHHLLAIGLSRLRAPVWCGMALSRTREIAGINLEFGFTRTSVIRVIRSTVAL